MQAWVYERGAKRPVQRAWDEPRAGAGEVVVEVEATALHPVDVESSEGGNAMMLPMARPFVGGVDYVGRVATTGAGAPEHLSVGTRVFGYRGVPVQGAWADRIRVPAAEVAVAPDLPVATLATLPLPSLSALQALDTTGVGSGASVLVHGGAGGVGSVAVQAFAGRGARVIATARAADGEWVRSLGADEVIDYTTTRFDDVLRDLDLVFDTVGGDTLKRSFAVVRPEGAVVSLSALPPVDALLGAGMSVPLPLRAMLPLATWWGGRAARARNVRYAGQVTVASGERLAEAARMAAEHRWETRIDRSFDWTQLASAMDHAASGKARGRVVVVRDAQ